MKEGPGVLSFGVALRQGSSSIYELWESHRDSFREAMAGYKGPSELKTQLGQLLVSFSAFTRLDLESTRAGLIEKAIDKLLLVLAHCTEDGNTASLSMLSGGGS